MLDQVIFKIPVNYNQVPEQTLEQNRMENPLKSNEKHIRHGNLLTIYWKIIMYEKRNANLYKFSCFIHKVKSNGSMNENFFVVI